MCTYSQDQCRKSGRKWVRHAVQLAPPFGKISFPGQSRTSLHHYIAMFTAYFDASGNKQNSVLTVAGFVSRVNRWERFENEWRSLLPSSVSMFHMTDFVSSQNGWEDWKGPQNGHRRKVLIERLVSCIKGATNKGFTQSLRLRHYHECDREYMLTEKYDQPYVMLGLGCLGALAAWATKKDINKHNILCIFEEGDDGQGTLIKMARDDGFNAIPQSKKDIRAFDACDLAAWKSRAMIDDAWERLLPMKDPDAGARIMRTLEQIEDVIKDSRNAAMFSVHGLKTICKNQGISER